MKIVRSIRGRLLFNSLLVGALLLGLVGGFAAFYNRISRQLDLMYQTQIVPQRNLVAIQQGIDAIYARMQRVMLAQASSQGALLLLQRQQSEIIDKWRAFKNAHVVRKGDAAEAELVADIDRGFAEFDRLMSRVAAAYAVFDPEALRQILVNDWYQLDLSLLFPFRELIDRQNTHAEASYVDLHTALNDAARVMSAILLAVVGLISAGAWSLSRYVNRRIRAIETTLEAVSGDDPVAFVAFPKREREMARIARAINATVSRLAEDRLAILHLMETNSAVLRATPDGIYGVDTGGKTIFANAACQHLLGFSEAELLGSDPHELFHHHREDGGPYPVAECPILLVRTSGEQIERDDEVFFRKDASNFPVEYTATPMFDRDGRCTGTVVVFRDITVRQGQAKAQRQLIETLRQTNQKLEQVKGQLLQAEKMAAIGQLAAGVAHEINNPIGYVSSNLTTLDRYAQDLMGVLDLLQASIAGGDAIPAESVAALRVAVVDADIAYLREDLGALIGESREGLERVKKIVLDLKNFARADTAGWQPADLNAGIESTLNVVWNELKYRAEVVRDFGELPLVTCDPGKVNQVFMNLLVNAAHAMPARGTITVRTRADGDFAVVSVRDDGSGIAPEHLSKIFDPFFTTKPVGKGTGLGLSLAYGIIRDHGGTIDVASEVGVGTTFTVRLPIDGKPPVDTVLDTGFPEHA